MTVDQHPSHITDYIGGLTEVPAIEFGPQAHIHIGLVDTSVAEALMPGMEFDHHPQQLVAVLVGEQGIISAVAIPIETGRIEGHNKIDWNTRIDYARQRFVDAGLSAMVQA